MRGVEERPAGLVYQPDLIDEDEERQLLAVLTALELRDVRMHGQVARRTVRHFGFDYDYGSFQLTATDALPPGMEWVRQRCAQLAGVECDLLAQTLVTRYPPGGVIGWHRDAPAFGPTVVGLSLGSACVMRFQRRRGQERRVYELPLAPRSAYVLGGAARSTWQHSIPAVTELRYSVTFRMIRPSAHPPVSATVPPDDEGVQ
ncbi:Alkylated DNA repair dioxygenase AlkB [Micromonospora pattaloongensis]|uniref:Alkylated DNA repair dioxygenase AlkB n=1 Tax=Micromonospora pattaloongensis TaxID=405436 RepID=A0A1H3RUM8_9ACTN|nr:alpha-ketoglutarate-dependent dioxygenase AlkB [Micromonospora pattaloongensis]SDZ29320.1 Alkylated DNA repair dioxygenase AlkB [Micromonospora pattaloongensis]